MSRAGAGILAVLMALAGFGVWGAELGHVGDVGAVVCLFVALVFMAHALGGSDGL